VEREKQDLLRHDEHRLESEQGLCILVEGTRLLCGGTEEHGSVRSGVSARGVPGQPVTCGLFSSRGEDLNL
jgi:hypothetical protein